MGSLYRNDINKYKKYFNEAAKLLGVDVSYKYLIKRNTEKQSGESVYSEYSQPIIQSVVVEQGLPKVDSLKQLGWFTDINMEQLLVDFSISTPNLQEGCRFSFISNENEEQNKEYIIIKMSNSLLYPACIKCLCQPLLATESTYLKDGNIFYGQQEIYSDDENNVFISEPAEFKYF